MSLGWRFALVLAAVAAAVAATVAVAAQVATGQELHAQLDRFLDGRALQVAEQLRKERAAPPARPGRPPPPASPLGQSDAAVQVLDHTGTVVDHGGDLALPVGPSDVAVAAGRSHAVSRNVVVGGEQLRLRTVGLPDGGAVQVAQPDAGLERVLSRLRTRLVVLVLVGVAASALIGSVVARRVTRPVVRLTRAAEHVARTADLAVALPTGGDDEVARLARAFETMLVALAASQEQQQRLVEDASHELRTPLTSLATNIAVLRSPDAGRLSAEDRARLHDDLTSEMAELSGLVGELVVLARDPGAAGEGDLEALRLDELVATVAERASRRTGRNVDVQTSPTTVRGRRAQLERAVANLIGNADKFSPPGEAIAVLVSDGRVEVRDRGPGIAHEDRSHVVERFWRSPAARSAPGSGLGLAIVDQVVRAHGGVVEVGDAPGGGAAVGFRIPPDPTWPGT